MSALPGCQKSRLLVEGRSSLALLAPRVYTLRPTRSAPDLASTRARKCFHISSGLLYKNKRKHSKTKQKPHKKHTKKKTKQTKIKLKHKTKTKPSQIPNQNTQQTENTK